VAKCIHPILLDSQLLSHRLDVVTHDGTQPQAVYQRRMPLALGALARTVE
jgi:hypothetical protein